MTAPVQAEALDRGIKRPASTIAIDQLPYQRRTTFGACIFDSLEDKVRKFIAAQIANDSVRGGNANDGARDEQHLRVSLGCVRGKGTHRDIALPGATETVLDDDGAWEFDPCCLGKAELSRIQEVLDKQSREAVENSERRGPWRKVSMSHKALEQYPFSWPRSALTVLRPCSPFHYQVEVVSQGFENQSRTGAVGGNQTATQQAVEAIEGSCSQRIYLFQTGGDGSLWWRVVITQGQNRGGLTVEVSPKDLCDQYARMASSKVHGFSLIVRDLLLNVRSLCEVAHGSGIDRAETFQPNLFFPGILDHSKIVRKQYDKKVRTLGAPNNNAENQKATGWDNDKGKGWIGRGKAHSKGKQRDKGKDSGKGNLVLDKVSGDRHVPQELDRDESEAIRAFNNLIKTVLVEKFVPPVTKANPENSFCVLDLGCGHGQDLLKFSRQFRGSIIQKYVGVDFSESSIAEAKTRYKVQCERLRDNGFGQEFVAAFFTGDIRQEATFERLANAGHCHFDLITAQFCIHYLAETEDIMRGFLKQVWDLLLPGGRMLVTLPCCDQIAELAEEGRSHNGAVGNRIRFGNRLYSLELDVTTLESFLNSADSLPDLLAQHWGVPLKFSLFGAIDDSHEFVVPWGALEALCEDIGFEIEMDADFPSVCKDPICLESKFYTEVFSRTPRELSKEEQEVFSLYRCFVLQRPHGKA